jgi:hypothetical protein
VENNFVFMKENSKVFDFIKKIDGELYVFDDFTKEGENAYKVTLVNVNDKNKTHTQINTHEPAENLFTGITPFLNLEKTKNLISEDIEIVRTPLNYNDWKTLFEKFGQKIDKPEKIDEMDLVMLKIPPEDFKNNSVFKPIAQIFEKEGFKEFSSLVFKKIGEGKQVEFISFPLDNNKTLKVSPKILKDLQEYVQILNLKDNFPEANDIINIANLTQFGESLDIYYINSKGEQAKISVPREDFSNIKKDNKKGIDVIRIGSKTIPIDNIYGAILRGIEKNIGLVNPEFILVKRGNELVRTRKVKTPYNIYGINWSKALPYLVSDELKIYILNIPLFPSQRQALKISAILKNLNEIEKEINKINESLKTASEQEKADLSVRLEDLQKERERLEKEFKKIAKKFIGKLKDDFMIHYAILRKDGGIIIKEDNFSDFFKNVREYINDNYKMSLEEFLEKYNAQLLVKFKDTGSIVVSKEEEKGRKKIKKIADDIADVNEKDLEDAKVKVYDFKIDEEFYNKLSKIGYDDPDIISFFVRNYGEKGLERMIKLDLKYEDYIALLSKGYNINDIKEYIFDPSLSLEKAKNNLSQMLKFNKKDFLSGKTKIEEATEEEEIREVEKVEEEITEEKKKVEEKIEEEKKEEKPIIISSDILEKLKELGYTDLMIEGITKEATEEEIKRKIDLKLTPQDDATLFTNKYTKEDIEKYLFEVPLEEARKNLEKMLSMKKEEFISTLEIVEKPKVEKAEEEKDRIELIEDNIKLLLDLGWNRELLIRYIKNKEIIEDIIENEKSYLDVVKKMASKYGFRPEDLNKMDPEEIYQKINKFYNPEEIVFYLNPRFIKVILRKEFSSIFSHHLSDFLNPLILFWQKQLLFYLDYAKFVNTLDDVSLSVLFSKLQQEGIINFEKFDREVTPDVIHRYISGIEYNR